MRRWRGMIDVPLTDQGAWAADSLRQKLDLDIVYHDHLRRCEDTAILLNARVTVTDDGPLPWNMGSLFQGREITEDSLKMARWYIYGNHRGKPPGGESFATWRSRWYSWIQNLRTGYAAAGVVTHNRNIQYLYSLHNGHLIPKLYDVHGPDFCSVHVYDLRTGHIAPWGGRNVPPGIYLIRHAETEFGT